MLVFCRSNREWLYSIWPWFRANSVAYFNGICRNNGNFETTEYLFNFTSSYSLWKKVRYVEPRIETGIFFRWIKPVEETTMFQILYVVSVSIQCFCLFLVELLHSNFTLQSLQSFISKFTINLIRIELMWKKIIRELYLAKPMMIWRTGKLFDKKSNHVTQTAQKFTKQIIISHVSQTLHKKLATLSLKNEKWKNSQISTFYQFSQPFQNLPYYLSLISTTKLKPRIINLTSPKIMMKAHIKVREIIKFFNQAVVRLWLSKVHIP